MNATTSRLLSSVRNDPEAPNFVWAPARDDRNLAVRLFVNPITIRQMVDDHRNAGIGQFAALIHGSITYTSLGGMRRREALGGLQNAVALFRGISRPMAGSGTDRHPIIDFHDDREVYVYVTNPGSDYVWPSQRRFSPLGPQEAPKPEASVFATFVVFDKGVIASAVEAIREAGGGQVDGIVQNWEWTLASAKDPSLPDDFENRYEERLWV